MTSRQDWMNCSEELANHISEGSMSEHSAWIKVKITSNRGILVIVPTLEVKTMVSHILPISISRITGETAIPNTEMTVIVIES